MKPAVAIALVAVLAAGAVVVRAADAELVLAGSGAAALALLLAPAVALTAAGVATSRPVLVAAAATWCAAQLISPAAPGAALFTAGIVVGTSAPGIVALAMAPGRRAAAALAITSTGLLGLLVALVFDPTAAGCSECPANLLLVRGDAGAVELLQRGGLWLGLAAIGGVLAGLAAWWRRAGLAARERRGPGLIALSVYLIAVAAQYAHGIPRGYLSADPTDRVLWTIQAGTLLAVAAGVAWEPIRERRARARLTRLVIELEAHPEPHGLRDILAGMLHDPGLSLGYLLRDGRVVDVLGRPFGPRAGQIVTALHGGDELLAHAPRLFDAPTIASGARLTLHNEHLRAELGARLGDLRAMRGRIVAAADAERRRLERDLHDGAQQGLASLAVAVAGRTNQQTTSRHSRSPRPSSGRRCVHSATSRTASSRPCWRTRASRRRSRPRGDRRHPGLPSDPLPPGGCRHRRGDGVPRGRRDGAPRRRGGDDPGVRENGRLRLWIAAAVPPAEALLDLDDRVGALGGMLRIRSRGLELELPCAS